MGHHQLQGPPLTYQCRDTGKGGNKQHKTSKGTHWVAASRLWSEADTSNGRNRIQNTDCKETQGNARE